MVNRRPLLPALFLACAAACQAAPGLPPLTCAPPRMFDDGKTPLAIQHVSPGGDDDRGDGSPARPFRSIGRAARELSPGMAIQVHAGAYDGGIALQNIRGTADAPIWIRGAPDEARPTIRGGGQGLYLTRPQYVVLDHLEITETRDNGINVDDSGNVDDGAAARSLVFRDLEIHDTGRQPSGVPDCLKLAGVNDFVIVDSRFARCGLSPQSGAVGVGGVGVHHGIVSGSTFKDTGFGGAQFKGGATDVELIGNRFESAGDRAVNMGGRTGAEFFRPPLTTEAPNAEASRIHVTGNIFVGGESAAAFVGCLDCTFTRNTVVDPSRWVLRILQETVMLDTYAFAPTSRGIISGNAFYFRRADLEFGEDINVGGQTETASFMLADNAWHAHDAPERSAPILGAFAGEQRANVAGVAPRFTDPAAGDYRVEPVDGMFPPGVPSTCRVAPVEGSPRP